MSGGDRQAPRWRNARDNPRVALVYPPMGPCGLPSLGLGLLSAGIRRRGIECRTFYWNFDLIDQMPGKDLRARYEQYHSLTGRLWFPFNEWIFSRALYSEMPVQHELAARAELRELARQMPDRTGLRYEDLERLRTLAPAFTEAMLARLMDYDVVGIASTFYQNLAALALARRLRERHPEKIVVLGGANCDGEMGRALLEQFEFVDNVFSGEVDHAVPDFIEGLARGTSVDGVPGLVRRDRGREVRVGPPSIPIEDLDALPFPDFDDYMVERSRAKLDTLFDTTLALESSRGCWWGARQHCTFCGLNANGMAYRQKDPDRFKDEASFVTRKYGAKFVFMTDNILAMSYYDEFAKWTREAGLGVQYFYEIKSNVKRLHVERMADAGITAVQPGIESFSSAVLAWMRKGTTAAQNVAFLKYAREYGILPAYNLLVGFPGEDKDEYARMAAELPKLVHLRPPSSMPEVEFHRFSPYQRTPDAFHIRLRPSRRYRHLYPGVSEDALSRMVYMFERDDADTLDRAYVGPVLDAVLNWHRAYREDCSLVWMDDGADVLIEDARPGFPRRRYRLQGYATRLFHELDGPRSLASLRRHAEVEAEAEAAALLAYLLGRGPLPGLGEARDGEYLIAFAAHEFVADPARCLDPLVAAGLLFVDVPAPRSARRRLTLVERDDEGDAGAAADARYIALPVRAGYRSTQVRWLDIGV
jgi:ribosomal peptide maturation radical SAM protein 1